MRAGTTFEPVWQGSDYGWKDASRREIVSWNDRASFRWRGRIYYTTHGLALPSFLQTRNTPASADLDAVASAWAEPLKAQVADLSLSSPVALGKAGIDSAREASGQNCDRRSVRSSCRGAGKGKC